VKILWNPWRYEYIKQFSSKTTKTAEECLLCKLQKMPEDYALIVHKGQYAFVVLNAYPYNTGHLMIAPYLHVADITELDESTVLEIMSLLKKCIRVLRATFNPDGFNIGANIGRAAGAGIPDHFHLHVVPRWVGDSNFMVVIANTKPLPMGLREAYEAIRKQWLDEAE